MALEVRLHRSNKRHATRTARGGRSGAFTLVELLAVIGIIGIMTSLAVVSLGGVSTSSQVASAAARLADSAELARQNAIATGVPTRVAVAVDGWPISQQKNFRTYVVVQRQEAAGALSWTPIRRWDELPAGVSFRQNAVGKGTSILSDPTSPTMTLTGPSGSLQAKYIEYLSSGQVRPEFPGGASLIIARGEPTEDKGSNWAEINSHPVTGKVSVSRP